MAKGTSSKTDTDATFMRMKEDHMRNGKLKPAYNVQISTNNQFIASYSIHQNTTDTNTLTHHLQEHIKNYHQKPSSVTADAGYGSEENYQWLEEKRITAYVKHSHFDRNQNKTIRDKNPYTTDKLAYDQDNDQFICPSGKPMKYIYSSVRRTVTGFKQTLDFYHANKSNGCPLRTDCHDQKVNRVIQVNHNLNRLKEQANKRLISKKEWKKERRDTLTQSLCSGTSSIITTSSDLCSAASTKWPLKQVC